MKVWFTSDYHLGHANIISYCNRPFKSEEEMTKTIIRNHNARVKPEDTVFFLGDFCFKNSKGGKNGEGATKSSQEYLKLLNGRFIFIRGNHDHHNSLKAYITRAVIDFGGREVYLVHNPNEYNEQFEINLVGHVHQNWKSRMTEYKTILVNVGVDVWDFRPISWQEIEKEINRIKKEAKL